jgi:hypothetical protein
MTSPYAEEATTVHPLRALREIRWKPIPKGPGVYWWYFPTSSLERFGLAATAEKLNLRRSPGGMVCLYHGLAKSLAQRIEWHAAQRLGRSALDSGFLSTFRLTLLALNDFDYSAGSAAIDAFMDQMEVTWKELPDEAAAHAFEAAELAGPFHYPLNIQGNRRRELTAFTATLKAKRKAYVSKWRLALKPAARE